MDTSTRQAVLAGKTILPLDELSAEEQLIVLERVLRNCMRRIEYFAGFRPMRDQISSWRIGLEKDRRLGARYWRDIGVSFTPPLNPKTRAIKVCDLFQRNEPLAGQEEISEKVLYLTQKGVWLAWTTTYEVPRPIVEGRIGGGQDAYKALKSTVVNITSLDLVEIIHPAKDAHVLARIVERLIEIGEETLEQRESDTNGVRRYVRDQELLARLIGIRTDH